MLGAVLSRAVVGASPFLPTIMCSLLLVLIHRAIAWYSIYNPKLKQLVKGKSQVLYQHKTINKENMRHCLMSDEDLESDIRIKAQTNSLIDLEAVYMETSGKVSVVKKK